MIYTLMIIIITAVSPLFSQDAAFETAHYAVVSENGIADARAFAKQLETFWGFFNQHFRFDDNSESKLNVTIFSSQDTYDAHLATRNQEPQKGFVYLHYGSSSRNVLLGYKGAEEKTSLSRNAFLQFLRQHIHTPPTWIAEGFSVYFESAQYNPQVGIIEFSESLSRAENIQAIIESDNKLPIPLSKFFITDTAGIQDNSQEFYSMAWAVVSFFLNAPSPQYTRILWETITKMGTEETSKSNAQQVIDYIDTWASLRKLEEEIVAYVDGLKTFRSIMGEGIRLYQEKNYEEANEQFIQAMQIKPDNYTPYYYRGLLSYEQGNYDIAEVFYEEAAQKNMDEHLANYVFGLILYARGNVVDAIERLERIPAESIYFNRANNLLATWH